MINSGWRAAVEALRSEVEFLRSQNMKLLEMVAFLKERGASLGPEHLSMSWERYSLDEAPDSEMEDDE